MSSLSRLAVAMTIAAVCTFRADADSTKTISASPAAQPAPPRPKVSVSYNRNALRDSIVVGDVAIALTEAGTLLRFQLPAVSLTGEYFGAVPITCIGLRNDEVLAGAEDGTVYGVDVSKLKLRSIGRVPGRPVWVSPVASERGPTAIAVVSTGKQGTQPEFGRWLYERNVHLLPEGKTIPIDGDFSGSESYYLAGRRLFVGLDTGEFGGRHGHLDLDSGRQKWVKSEGVYGFTTVAGRVLAFGGTAHPGRAHAFVTEAGDGVSPRLYEQRDSDPGAPEAESPQPRPDLPINSIIRDPASGDLLVFSYDQVFRVDPAFETWAIEAQFALDYTRSPDEIGSYSPIVKVGFLPATARYLVATRLNGYVVMGAGRVASMSIPQEQAGVQFDTLDARLAKFAHDEDFAAARLAYRRLDRNHRIDVHDAVALGPSRFLMATSAGLKILDTHSNDLATPDFPLPPVEIRTMAKDRKGRVWLGGKGVWMLREQRLLDIGKDMSASGTDVAAIAADPTSDGVIALLRRRMVVFLSLD